MGQNETAGLWIVTGAASGIGAAVVKAVRNSGVDVIALDVDEARGLALAEETGALYRSLDVGDLSQWQQLADYLDADGAHLGRQPAFTSMRAFKSLRQKHRCLSIS